MQVSSQFTSDKVQNNILLWYLIAKCLKAFKFFFQGKIPLIVLATNNKISFKTYVRNQAL